MRVRGLASADFLFLAIALCLGFRMGCMSGCGRGRLLGSQHRSQQKTLLE